MEPAAVNPGWRKSSHSSQSGATSCVEVAAIPWRKSSHSGQSGGGSCVEVGAVGSRAAGAVLIRDTTQRGNGPVLRVSAEAWRAFTTAIRTLSRCS